MSILFKLLLTLLPLIFIIPLFGQGSVMPDANIKSLEGQTISFKEAVSAEGLTIVSFWATWCAPCKKELDAIAEIYDEWVENYQVRLVAISVDDARAAAKVKPMVAEKAWPYEVFIDTNQELMRALHFQTVPYTIIVDSKGEIVYNHSGYLPGDEIELEEKIVQLSQ
jgi:thiol-disulfide isomerase/thioredoxin